MNKEDKLANLYIIILCFFISLFGIYQYFYLPYDFHESPVISDTLPITNKFIDEDPGSRGQLPYSVYYFTINLVNGDHPISKNISVSHNNYNHLTIGQKVKVSYQIGKDKEINILSVIN